MSGYLDLGTYAREITTSSAEAQAWFTRGLAWAYSFNHEEAARCFERAIGADPGCALAHWGLAYVLGPNYNKPWEAFDPADLSSSVSRAFAASRTAAACRLSGGRRAVKPLLAAAMAASRHTPFRCRRPIPFTTGDRARPVGRAGGSLWRQTRALVRHSGLAAP